MFTVIALCAIGAEKVLANELRKLGFSITDSHPGRLRYQTDLGGMYRSLFMLRTADRLLLEAGRYEAQDFDALYEGARNIPWENYLPRSRPIVVSKVHSAHSRLTAITSIQSVVHKALADRLCTLWKVRRLPETGDPISLRVYVEKDQVQILLDITGEPLFKRGYRQEGGVAPLRETTAAAMLLLSGWRRKFPLYDPFCGSGTILIEAALYAWEIPPGLGRTFVLSQLPFGAPSLEESLRKELKAVIRTDIPLYIQGSDKEKSAVEGARHNLERALQLIHHPVEGDHPSTVSVAKLPTFRRCSIEELRSGEEQGFLITNPPYGERLGTQEEAEALYRLFGQQVPHFAGWKLAVITTHPGFESHFGYRATSVRKITNGALPSIIYLYDSLPEGVSREAPPAQNKSPRFSENVKKPYTGASYVHYRGT